MIHFNQHTDADIVMTALHKIVKGIGFIFRRNMEYSLAKELKETGFPQPKLTPTQNTQGTDAYFPTLEELIEACGNDFGGLSNFGGKIGWRAYTKSHSPDVEDRDWLQEDAPTPTEAVARLWLALNKK